MCLYKQKNKKDISKFFDHLNIQLNHMNLTKLKTRSKKLIISQNIQPQ
jgi:hypothetical protein